MRTIQMRFFGAGLILFFSGIFVGSSAYAESGDVSAVQARMRSVLEYRSSIPALDVEFDVEGEEAPEKYSYVRRFRMLNDLRKQEDWIDGRRIRMRDDVRGEGSFDQSAGRTRELTLFDGERHAVFNDAFENAGMLLTDRELMPEVSGCRFDDARLAGLIPVGCDSLSGIGPEQVYLSKKASDGRIERVGATEVLRWKVFWPEGADVYEVTLDPACDGQPTHARLSWADKSGRHSDEIRVEYRRTNGVFFPSKIAYEHLDDDVRTRWENVDVRVVHLNEGLDRSDFSLARADVPALTPVALARGPGESLWWDGRAVVGLEQLQADQARRRTIQWTIAGVLGVAAAGVTFVLLRRRKK